MVRGISSGEVAAARRIGLKRGRFVFGVLAAVALCPAGAVAQAKTFSYTGGEQTFVVPPKLSWSSFSRRAEVAGTAAGSGAVVSALLNVTPGEVRTSRSEGSARLPQLAARAASRRR